MPKAKDGGIVNCGICSRSSLTIPRRLSAEPPLHKGALGACDICKGERYLKATGIVRRVDDLGRIVISKEIRRTLKIREGAPLSYNIDTNRPLLLGVT